MALLRKKKYEEEEIDEEMDEKYSRTKKIRAKDKNSDDKKSRVKKEPKKPWGKKERYLVLITLLLTAGTSAILGLSARSWKLPGLPRLGIPKFSIPFMGEETIYIEGTNSDQKKAEEVIVQFEAVVKDLSGVYGLYVVDLNNGFSYGFNDNEVFEAASLIKLPVMVGMYQEFEKGTIDPEEKYSLKAGDKIKGSGSLYAKPAGYTLTYRNLVELLGKQSDNTAFNVCRKKLGEEKISAILNGIGMADTSVSNNQTTPQDIGRFFEELWQGNIVSKESTDEILNTMTDTIYEDWLSKGIPAEIRVAHKFGRDTHVVNDAGIVFTGKPFVVVILGKGVVEAEANAVFPELAKLVYDKETAAY